MSETTKDSTNGINGTAATQRKKILINAFVRNLDVQIARGTCIELGNRI